MSNDLISRRILLQKIQEDKEFLQKGLGRNAEYAYISADSIIDKIKSMPIDYDVDKIADRIGELESKSIPRYKNETFGDYEGMDYYIKKNEVERIIKAGGV